LTGPASAGEKVFICPSDPTFCNQIQHAFTGYAFNGYEVSAGSIPRLTGRRLSVIKNPTKAVLAGEVPAFFGGAWHPLANPNHADAKNVLSFADSHVCFARIYWDGIPGSKPCKYEPPGGYSYNWDGD
jgi:hypothetical protein